MFGPKVVIMTLKRVYMIKKSSYLYSVNNFLSYPNMGYPNLSLYKHNIPTVCYRITRPNKQTPFIRLNKSLYWVRVQL